MNKAKALVMVGSILLILGGFLPWISVPDLFGLSGTAYQGLAIGWEGDGVLTTGAGLALILGELIFGAEPRRWTKLAGIVLAALAACVVLLDFGRIIEIGPEAGFFAATGIGIFITLTGALLALIGCLWKHVPAPRQPGPAGSGSMV